MAKNLSTLASLRALLERRNVTVPRGWVLLGLALIAWLLVAVVVLGLMLLWR